MTALLVASTGGHLADLVELAQRMIGLGENRLWVTFNDEHGRTLLEGENKVLIPNIAERDVAGVLRGLVSARRILGKQRITAVVSTGSGIALSFLPYAVSRGIEAHYIECSARVDRPSLTGRLLQTVPGVCRYRQYPHAARGRWRYRGSVFDGFQGGHAGPRPVTRVVVTLGTMRQSFRRLIERVATILPAETEVLWQTGSTPIERLGIKAQPFMPARALAQAAGEADVVIAHAGCGSALMALKAGKYPLLVARDPSHGEVVDGHQAEIAHWLSQRNLALERTPDQLTLADLQAAAGRSVVRLTVPPAFELSGGRQARS